MWDFIPLQELIWGGKRLKMKKESWNWSIPRSIYFGPNGKISINSAQDQHKKPNLNSYPPHTWLSLSLSLSETMAGKSITGEGLSANLAGMSKNQLYEIMSQMKVNYFLILSLRTFFEFIFFFLLIHPFPSLHFRNFLFFQTLTNLSDKNRNYNRICFILLLALQALIEQNQQQARQILIQNPLLTKALFQVPNF